MIRYTEYKGSFNQCGLDLANTGFLFNSVILQYRTLKLHPITQRTQTYHGVNILRNELRYNTGLYLIAAVIFKDN